MSSIWFKDMIAVIRKKALQANLSLNVLCLEENNIVWAELPKVVILATGSLAFIKHVLKRIQPANRHVILAGLDSQPFGSEISCVTPSRQSETSLVISYFNYYNRNKIALVGFRKDGINDMLRYQTAITAISTYNEEARDDISFFWDTSLTSCMENFFQSADKFNAAITPNDATAICLINACKNQEIRVPEDLYVASFTNMRVGRYSKPSLTTVAMDFPSIGEQTFNVWSFLNDHKSKDIALRLHVPSKLIVRKSTDFSPKPPFDQSVPLIDFYEVKENFSDTFFESPHIQSIMQIEDCISRRDNLDLKIIFGLLSEITYEAISEKLFISISGVRYRVNKIYKDAGVSTRVDFVKLFQKYLGDLNLFAA
jgi:DNA-binding LacI/PurR family transcriptional regulator